MQPESMEHLFWECHHVQIMWNGLENLIDINGLPIVFNLKIQKFWNFAKQLEK
jgi:hypothetical protein